VAAVQVAAVGEGVSRGLHTVSGHKSGGAWLRGLVPVAPYVAHPRGVLAQELPAAELAPTREGFAAGDLAAGHAAAVCRSMRALDRVAEVDAETWGEAQRLLVGEAGRVDPVQLGRAGLHLVRRLDPQGPERLAQDEQAQHAARFASLHQERSGMWFLTASLPALGGAMLHAALDPLAAPRPASDGSPDPRSRQQRLADAVVGLAELSLAQRGGDRGALPSRHGSPVRVLVTGEVAALLANPAVRHGQAGGATQSQCAVMTAGTQHVECRAVPVHRQRSRRELQAGVQAVHPRAVGVQPTGVGLPVEVLLRGCSKERPLTYSDATQSQAPRS
jgi:hypothetical protein